MSFETLNRRKSKIIVYINNWTQLTEVNFDSCFLHLLKRSQSRKILGIIRTHCTYEYEKYFFEAYVKITN